MRTLKVGATVLVLASALLPCLVLSAVAGTSADPNLARAKAVVARDCPRARGLQSTNMWQAGWTFNAIYGDCGGGDGHDQRVWFFAGGRFVGYDAPKSSAGIIGLWRDGSTIAFLYILYRANDALCCASGGGSDVRFHWTGKRVVALDALPAWSASRSHPAARYP